jgi:hypothetical protein
LEFAWDDTLDFPSLTTFLVPEDASPPADFTNERLVFTDDMLKQIEGRDLKLFVDGEVRYRDYRNRQQIVAFLGEYDPTTKDVIVIYQHHREAEDDNPN